MSTNVYLIGHGRVAENIPLPIPSTSKITMHWLARLGDVTGGISTAFLNGQHIAEYGQSVPGTTINEHYLTPDKGWPHDGKIKAFFSRPTHPNGSGDPYVLYTRPGIDVSLSSIFEFLEMLSPTNEWHVYWTCCRGFMGKANKYKSELQQGVVVSAKRPKDKRTVPAVVGLLGTKSTEGHKFLKADTGYALDSGSPKG